MQIREGAYYRTRCGDVVGPMKPVTVANDAPHPRYVWGCFGRTWTDSGDYDFGAGYLEEDLICEVYVIDTPPVVKENKAELRDMLVPAGPTHLVVKTLRDEFAMAALTGMMADHTAPDRPPEFFADLAYKYANSMMEARKK
jgi:hypothetical protein